MDYKESRSTFGLGLDAAVDLIPYREKQYYHLFLGAQVSGETAMIRKINTDQVLYEEKNNGNVYYDSTYTASPYIVFNKIVPVFSVYIRQQIMFTPAFGLHMMIGYRYAESPIVLNDISYSKRGAVASCYLTYTFERRVKSIE